VAKAKAAVWIDKVRKREYDVRTGAWIRFDIDEAIKTFDKEEMRSRGKEPGSQ
jgi:hypothetical protein